MVFLIALGLLFALLLCLGLTYVIMAPRWREAQALRRRLPAWTTTEDPTASVTLERKGIFSTIPLLDGFLKRFAWVHKLEHLRQQANSQFPLAVWLLLSILLGSSAWFFSAMYWVSSPLITLTAFFSGLLLPFAFLSYVKQKRIFRFQAQLPDALDTIARALRAGHSFVVGMQMVGEEFSDPIGTEFTKTIEQVTTGGIPFQKALGNLSNRLDCLDLKYFVTALIIQRDAGGNLTEILESIASLIRQRFDLQDRVKALSAEGRFSAGFLFVLPFLLGSAMYFMNREYLMILFTHPVGKDLLGGALIMLFLGILVTRKMIAIKV